MIERMGIFYKIFSMNVNGAKYYFIARINDDGFIWVFETMWQAEERFEEFEEYAKIIGIGPRN